MIIKKTKTETLVVMSAVDASIIMENCNKEFLARFILRNKENFPIISFIKEADLTAARLQKMNKRQLATHIMAMCTSTPDGGFVYMP